MQKTECDHFARYLGRIAEVQSAHDLDRAWFAIVACWMGHWGDQSMPEDELYAERCAAFAWEQHVRSLHGWEG